MGRNKKKDIKTRKKDLGIKPKIEAYSQNVEAEFEDMWIEISDCEAYYPADSKTFSDEEFNFDYDFEPIDTDHNDITYENGAGFAQFIDFNHADSHVDQFIYGLDQNGVERNLDLNLSNVVSSSSPLVTYDVDSMILKFDDNSLKRSINLSLICSSKPLISKDYGFRIGKNKMIYTPHMVIGDVDFWTIYLFFPNLARNNRRYRNGVSALRVDKIEFYETFIYPSLFEIASPLLKQKLPISYSHACAISGGHSQNNLNLNSIEFKRLISSLREKLKMSSKFKDFEFFAATKGKKMEFTSIENYFELINEAVDKNFDLNFVSNFFVDIAKTLTPSDLSHSFCFKKNVLRTVMENLTGCKNISIYKFMNCEDIEGANVKG